MAVVTARRSEMVARTEKQREASRVNGSKSRGPSTPEGKQRSRFNAQRHGLRSRLITAIERGVLVEDQATLDRLVESLVEALGPRDALENQIAEEIVGLYVR